MTVDDFIRPATWAEVVRRLRDRGVFSEILATYVREWAGGPTDSAYYTLIDSDPPDPQLALALVQSGAGLTFSNLRHDLDLRLFAESIQRTRVLRFIHDARSTTFLHPEVVQTASTVERLDCIRWDPGAAVDLTGMTRLVEVAASGSLAIGACALPGLRRLSVDLTKWPPDLKVAAPLELFSVVTKRGGFRPDSLLAPERLRWLHIEGGPIFDATSLLGLTSLAQVEFGRIGRLDNADRLLELPALRSISFSSVRSAPGADRLEAFEGHLLAENSHIFDAEAKARIRQSRPYWYVGRV